MDVLAQNIGRSSDLEIIQLVIVWHQVGVPIFDDISLVTYSAREAYEQSVSGAYTGRELLTRIETIVRQIEELDVRSLEPDFRSSLKQLLQRLIKLLGNLS